MEEFRPLLLKHYLLFKVANEKFAVDIADIESIHASKRKNGFDNMDDLKIAVRMYKRLVPIINLRQKLKLHNPDLVNPSLVFIKCKEIDIAPVIGLQVDEIIEIIETVVPKKTNGKSTRLIKAMIKLKTEVVMVLRLKDILTMDEFMNPAQLLLN
jgi:chemotaxis signal transduction protein